jgi:putative nucleotidyltransferase with HDIG domain
VRVWYRLRQFRKALFARPDQDGISLAQAILNPDLFNLFMKMQPSEQAHSIAIARQLKEQGETQPDLLAAALLHDVGKVRAPLSTWERAAIVLGGHFRPASTRHWGQSEDLRSWKRAFVVGEQHPAWGAEMASEAGASELTVTLIRRHQEQFNPDTTNPPEPANETLEEYFLHRLQALDRES